MARDSGNSEILKILVQTDGQEKKKTSTNNLKNNAICDLRASVWRPDDSPQRVKNPGEPRNFDGVGKTWRAEDLIP
jgi:hypothetical protein